ncbi:MAG: DNA polymerase/3'-5' exonuclease PolX [Bacteroidota bacterium]
MDKKAVASVLDEMATLLELQGANPFKSRAFQNASRAVEGLTQDLGSLVESGEITSIKGIGKSIAEIIGDLVRTGSSREYETLRKSFPAGVLEMLAIQGLGPKKVKILYEKLNLETLEQLEKAAKADKLAVLEGFGKKTQENILKGLETLKSSADKSLYPVAWEAAVEIRSAIDGMKEVVRCEIAGSLRRKKEIIGDIDIVTSAQDRYRGRIMEAFVSHPRVESVVAHGETKSSVVLSGGISCDLRIVTDGEFPFALNYFTGSKEHNVEMRARAKKYGWSLNEYGFSNLGDEGKRGKTKRVVRCRDEGDIYRSLDLQYIPPELRENMGEIEAAEEGRLPNLLEESDIRGTFHCHTTYSDGVNTLEEMAAAAKRLGWSYLGIGDHSKVARYAGGLTPQQARAQVEEIDQLNGRLKGFRVFSGTECDILPSGELDWSEKTLALFEYVVVSVHSSFKMTEADMTKRIIRALKHKRVTMLGHPTGRLLLSREPYPVDMIQVIDAASDYGKMIEINAHPMRLDIDWRLLKYAREKGVTIVINPDSHDVHGLRDVSHGVGIARKGWLEKKDVLNTRTTAEVSKIINRIRS